MATDSGFQSVAAAGSAGPPDQIARVMYASQANVKGPVYAEMERIRTAAVRNNEPAGVYTALMYQSGWFLQWKEGPGDALLRIMDRVAGDPRHHSMRIIHRSRGPRLLAGPWSMAIVQSEESSADLGERVMSLRRDMESGTRHTPPTVWRRVSTPLRNPGAAQQADPDAFDRVLVCSATGVDSFDVVQSLSRQFAAPVVGRRFAGAKDLDVGTDYVDFEYGHDRMARVIATARNGLLLPLTRAFLPDHSCLVMLQSGDVFHDRALMVKVVNACQGAMPAPTLLGVGADAAIHHEMFAAARSHGLIYLDVPLPHPADPALTWKAIEQYLAARRAAIDSGASPRFRHSAQ